MTLLFSPLESYFGPDGRPTSQGQQLLAQINRFVVATDASLATLDGDLAALHGIPAGGTAGQVLTKTSGVDYAADWENIAASGGSGSFTFDDGTASAGGSFTLEDGGA